MRDLIAAMSGVAFLLLLASCYLWLRGLPSRQMRSAARSSRPQATAVTNAQSFPGRYTLLRGGGSGGKLRAIRRPRSVNEVSSVIGVEHSETCIRPRALGVQLA
jgi:hypothetical protein